MEVKGTVVKKLAVESGISKSEKVWKKQTCIVDSGGEFNNEIAVSAFGDEKLASLDKLEVGMEVKILCNVYSREYNGRYFHNIDGYHFAIMGSEARFEMASGNILDNKDTMMNGSDDLPF